MRIYNSLTDKLEEFKPIREGKVSMYVCGPTVYNYVHIGNMRPAITFDMVRNYLEYLGYEVTYASNFTDINPKIIKAAEELGITEREVANKFIAAYLKDLEDYQCGKIDVHPTVLENLDNIYTFIQKLIEKGYAYEVDGDVYFRVNKIKDYGCLSNNTLDELESGARLEIDEKKEDPLDFALWRKSIEGEHFTSPWGEGIPGWHTECVVMINSIFGEKIDIHGGGVDLKFPHHENEIAQSMALNNNHLANYWMHNGHINVEGVKMSKSLGNFILAKDFIKNSKANIVKLAMFKTHYRLPFNIKEELFKECGLLDDKIYNTLKQANLQIQVSNITINQVKQDENINKIMDEDFNTPNLITYLLELIKELNTAIRNKGEISLLYDKINLIINILGLHYDLKTLSEDDKKTYQEWLKAKENKDYTKADELRKTLVNNNIL
ncbi:cysteine--tRNA ligase [Mycoplasma sp. CAG:956]|nr:cysteine--tRNA ligase [Mycoplasma sp. CAG:956]